MIIRNYYNYSRNSNATTTTTTATTTTTLACQVGDKNHYPKGPKDPIIFVLGFRIIVM